MSGGQNSRKHGKKKFIDFWTFYVIDSRRVHKLLIQCKSWGGPVCSIEELDSILHQKPDLVEQIVKTELTYYKHTHCADVVAAPSLIKLNKITHSERLSKLYILFNGQ